VCSSDLHRSQRLAIEGAIGVEDGLAERVDDLFPGWLARLNDLASELVGIDDNRATALEHAGDGTFPGGDPACQAYEYHGAELITGIRTPQETPLTGCLARL
jgi:hypothetical protein